MESRLLLDSRNGKFLKGRDKMAANFLLKPSLDFRVGVDYYCSLSYLQLYQPYVKLVDDVTLQLGDLSDPEDPESEILWDDDSEYTKTLAASSLANLLQEMQDFASEVPDFDGKIEGGVLDTKKVVAPWSRITIRERCLKLSSNIASALGHEISEFGSQAVYRQAVTPTIRRWCPQPFYCTSSVLSQQAVIGDGGGVSGDDQIPHGLSESLTRRQPYLCLLHLERSSVRGLDDTTIVYRSTQQNGMGWHRLDKGVLSQIDFAFYQGDGRLGTCDSINTHWTAELVMKQRMMLNFA